MRILSGLTAVLLPAAVYVLIAVSPSTTAWARTAFLAALAAPFVAVCVLGLAARGAPEEAVVVRAGRGVRSSRWAALGVTLAAGVFIPKMMWAVRLGHIGAEEKASLRMRLSVHHAAHGAFPASLEDVGPVPRLRIWTIDEQGLDHIHSATRRVSLYPGLERAGGFVEGPKGEPPPLPAGARDDGSWGYDPESGRVFISCTGLEPKLQNRPLFLY